MKPLILLATFLVARVVTAQTDFPSGLNIPEKQRRLLGVTDPLHYRQITAIPGRDQSIRITVDLITVPKKEGFWLARMEAYSAWPKVLSLIKEQKAISEEILSFTGRNGAGGFLAITEEKRYPSLFVQPNEPTDWSYVPPAPTPSEALRICIITQAYETRDVGERLEVVADIKGERVLVTVKGSVTRFVKFLTYPLGLKERFPGYTEPIFNNLIFPTVLALCPGKTMLVKICDVPSQVDKMGFVFLTADILDVEL